MKKIKVSVIGCGYWGKNLVRNLSELDCLASVCDAKPEVAEAAAKQYGVDNYSLEQVLHSDIDGVVIAAPAITHFDLARRALKAGKHVFVEKPIALKLDDAQKLCRVALQADRYLMVGHVLQYHPAFLELKRLISVGTLGRLQYIYSNRLNLGKIRTEENVLWCFSPHDVSMILSIMNGILPETIYATGACHVNPSIHDITTTHLTFKNNVQAHIFVSWLHPYKEQKLVVIGDRGMAVFDDCLPWEQKLKLYPHQVTWVDGLPQPERADGLNISVSSAEPLRLECQHFIDCIQNRHQPRTDGLEGVRVLRVLDAAQRSISKRKNISLSPEVLQFYTHDTAIADAGDYTI